MRYAADWRTLAIVGTWFCVEALAWRVGTQNIALDAAVAVLACTGSFLGAVAAHNALHCPVFHSRTLESLWRCVLTLVYGHPVSAYVPAHNLSHHLHLETAHDLMRTSKARWRTNLLNLVFFAPSISGALMRAEVGYLRYAWRRRRRWRNQALLELAVLIVTMGGLAAVDWRRLAVYVMVPHAYAAWGIITMNLLQHDGADSGSTYNHSRTFVGPFINWITFNNGFHAVHHMLPGLHWSLAPAAHARLVAPHVDPRLVECSFVGYLFRTFVWPGSRMRFDGVRLEPRPAGTDSPWYA
jgi:fatty acid desaturase